MLDDANHGRRGGRAHAAPAAAIALALLAAACGDDEPAPSGPGNEPDAGAACVPGERSGANGACLAAGTQDDGCDAGEHFTGGACRPAGIPPEACGAGFEPTDDRGCSPILPRGPCAPGEMAVPGEKVCHALADCGTTPWGDAPAEATTRYVDGTYAGPSSDGTQSTPYKSIQDAIDAAAPGAVVAVAAGSYAESLIVAKEVVIWGRCPEMVELVGGDPAAIEIGVGASGTRVHAIAVRGSGIGIAVTGATAVQADAVWIHDTGDPGFWVESLFAPSQATLLHGLVEASSKLGVNVLGASAIVEASVVRDVVEGGAGGDAIWAETVGTKHADVTVRGSLVERVHEAGVYGKKADVTVEDTVIREVMPITTTGYFGDAVGGEAGAAIHVVRSVLAGNHDAGVIGQGATVTIESTVVQGTDAASDGLFGRGIDVEPSALGQPSTLTVSDSLVDGNTSTGIYVGGATAVIEGTIVRGTRSRPADGLFGMGISSEAPGVSTTVRWSVIEGNHDVGFYIFGGEGRLEGTLVTDTVPREADMRFGRGIEVNPQLDPDFAAGQLAVVACRVEHNVDFGIYVGASSATIEATLVDDTLPSPADGYFGRGVGLEAWLSHYADAKIGHSSISRSHDFGMYVLDSEAALDSVAITDTSPDGDGNFGDGLGLTRFAPFGFAKLEVNASRIEKSARAGITGFGGSTSIQGTTLECNPIPLDGEPYEGHDPVFDDLGGNVCGCKGEETVCAIRSASLGPPQPAVEH